MPGKTGGFSCVFLAKIVSILLVILVMEGITGCGSGSTPTPIPIPVPEARFTVSTTISCPVPASHRQSLPTYIWLVLDRSKSMPRECAHSLEKFFLLPGFLVYVGKLVQPEKLYFAMELIGPDKEFLHPTPISKINERDIISQLGSPDDIIGNSPTNEYEKALERIKDQMSIQQVRRVAVILTDGTFSGPDYEKKERENISRTLRDIQNNGGEVYVLLCSTSNKGFWEELKANGLLSAPPYQFPEGIKEVGEKLFPGGSLRNMGWFSGPPNFEIPLPGKGITASVSLAIITNDDADFLLPYVDPKGKSGSILLERFVKNIYVGNHTFELSEFGPMDCQVPVLQFTRRQSVDVGFYIIQNSLWSGHRFNANVQISVNDGEGIVEFSPFQSLLASSCYTFSLKSSEIITPLEQNKFAWKPLFKSDRPCNLNASVYLQVAGEDILLECGTISLPIKFAPEPTQNNVTRTVEHDSPIEKQSFPFRYVPLFPKPEIYLCSSEEPPRGPLTDCDLVCGTPYPDEQTVVCPTPVTRPERYCVRAEFIEELPTKEHPIVVSESRLGYADSMYTIQFYKCLEKCCKYERLYFQWPESESTVAQSIIYTKSNGIWRKESHSR
jgi:hypothetical protein